MYGSWRRRSVTYHQSVQILVFLPPKCTNFGFFTTKMYEFWLFLRKCTNIGASTDVPDVPRRTSVVKALTLKMSMCLICPWTRRWPAGLCPYFERRSRSFCRTSHYSEYLNSRPYRPLDRDINMNTVQPMICTEMTIIT